MSIYTSRHRAYLVKKERIQQRYGVVVLMVLAFILFGPFFAADATHQAGHEDTTQKKFYEDTTFPYAKDPLLQNLNVNTALELIKKGTQVPGQTATTSTTGGTLQFIIRVVNFVLSFYVVIATGIIIYHGILILVSRGSDDKRKTALKVIVNIVIATAVVLFSYAIIQLVVEFFKSSGGIFK